MAEPDTAGSPSVDVSIRAPLERLEQDLARAQRSLSQFDKASGTKSLENLGSAGKRADDVLGDLEDQLVSTATAQAKLDVASASSVRALAQQNAEVRSVTSGYEEATSAADEHTRSLTGVIGGVASTANQFKGLALLAYAAIPAVRALVNPIIARGFGLIAGAAAATGPAIARVGAGIQAMGASAATATPVMAALAPTIGGAGASVASLGTALSTPAGLIAGITSALGPMLAFLSKISLPIFLIVVAFKALSAIISHGSDLLEKYGKAASSVFGGTELDEALKKLTQFQENTGNVTSAQAAYAAELASRLDQAKFRLQEFTKAQISINDLSLWFQKVWVNIVETIASAADATMNLFRALGQAWDKLTSLGTEIGKSLGEAIKQYIPERILRAIEWAMSKSSSGSFDVSPSSAERADIERQTALVAARARLSTAMGVAAGARDEKNKIGDTFAARFVVGNIDLAKKPEKKNELEDEKDAWDRATRSIAMHTSAIRADTLAIGAGAGTQEEFRAEFRLLEAARESDRGVTEEQIVAYTKLRASMSAEQAIKAAGMKLDAEDTEELLKLAPAIREAAAAREKAKVAYDIKRARESVFLSQDEIQIADKLKGIYPDIATALASVEAGQMRFNKLLSDSFNFTKSTAEDLTKTLAQGLMDGKSGVDILISALDALKAALLNSGIKDLFSGDPLTMAVGAVKVAAAFVVDMFSDDMKTAKELQKAKDAFANMSGEVRAFNNAADGFELSAFVSAMQQITKTGIELVKAAMAAGDVAAAIQLIHSGVRQINNQVDQFIKPKGNDVASQIANVNNEAQQIIGELNDLNSKYGLGLNRTAEILAAAAEQVLEIQRKAQEEIAKRRMSFQDRLFDATNDPNSLEIKLAQFDREMARAREEERRAGGEALLDLEAAFGAERLNVIRDFNAQAVEITRRAEQERLDVINGTAKSVLEYLQGLVSGPSATVSPLANFTNSQQLYNANLALAQGGNIDAQNKFPQLADNLEKAARAIYASTQGYQDIRNQIIAQGLALPAVQQATDPVVIAIRDSIVAIQAVTAGVDLVRTALNTGFATGNLATIAGVLLANLPAIDTNTSNSIDLNEMISALGPSGGNVLTKAQLDALQLARNATVGGLLTSAQIDALGLSKEQGNVLKVFQELDGNGNGVLERSELIRKASADIYDSTRESIARLGDTVYLLDITVDRLAQALGRLDQELAFSSSISTAATRIVNAINNHGAATVMMAQGQINILGRIWSASDFIANHVNATSTNAYISSAPGVPAVTFRSAEFGAVIPPYGRFIYGEHHPRGPFFGQAGASPLPITPSMPSFVNDNSAIRALCQEIAMLRKELSGALGGDGPIVKKTGESALYLREGVDRVHNDLSDMKRVANMRP